MPILCTNLNMKISEPGIADDIDNGDKNNDMIITPAPSAALH